MLDKRVWAALLDVEGAVVEDVEFDPVGQVVTAFVRPARRARLNRPGMSGDSGNSGAVHSDWGASREVV